MRQFLNEKTKSEGAVKAVGHVMLKGNKRGYVCHLPNCDMSTWKQ